MASARARRWPSERSRGWRSRGIPGSTRSSVCRGRPRREGRHLVRGAALVLHALPVEEQPRILGHQPDMADQVCRRRAIGGPGRRSRRRHGSGRRTPESVLSSVDLPDPFLPISASTSPGMIVRSTPSSATTGPYETASFVHRRRLGARSVGRDADAAPARGGDTGRAARGADADHPASVAHRQRAADPTRRAGPTRRGAGRPRTTA